MINLSPYVRQRLSLSVLSSLRVRGHRGLAASSSFLNSRTKTEVPVASYTRSQKPGTDAAERTTLKVDKSEPSSSAPVSGGDADRKSVAFDRSVVAKLTPTMKRFTLEGKVAVVTG